MKGRQFEISIEKSKHLGYIGALTTRTRIRDTVFVYRTPRGVRRNRDSFELDDLGLPVYLSVIGSRVGSERRLRNI
jgi:hypothetical protein